MYQLQKTMDASNKHVTTNSIQKKDFTKKIQTYKLNSLDIRYYER